MLRLVIGFLFPPIPHVNRFATWAQAAPKAFRINRISGPGVYGTPKGALVSLINLKIL
jgi:hypothetical protein